MSGYSDEALIQYRVREVGIRFISKPFSAVELTNKVREVLDEGKESDTTGQRLN